MPPFPSHAPISSVILHLGSNNSLSKISSRSCPIFTETLLGFPWHWENFGLLLMILQILGDLTQAFSLMLPHFLLPAFTELEWHQPVLVSLRAWHISPCLMTVVLFQNAPPPLFPSSSPQLKYYFSKILSLTLSKSGPTSPKLFIFCESSAIWLVCVLVFAYSFSCIDWKPHRVVSTFFSVWYVIWHMIGTQNSTEQTDTWRQAPLLSWTSSNVAPKTKHKFPSRS
jgi:hypothetical protein